MNRRPLSEYAIFMKINSERIRQINPGIDQKTLFRTVSEMWALAPQNPKNIGRN